MEQTEQLNHQARVAAAKSKYKADEEIVEMEHTLELRKAELKKIQFEKDSALARERIEDELAHDRLRLAFEKEELEVLRGQSGVVNADTPGSPVGRGQSKLEERQDRHISNPSRACSRLCASHAVPKPSAKGPGTQKRDIV